MAKRRVILTFPEEMITQPIIYQLGGQFRLVTNILRANVERERGWVVLELEGEEADIEEALAWVMARGVRVDPVSLEEEAGRF